MADYNKMIKLSPHELELLDKINELFKSEADITSEIDAIKTELQNSGSKIVISDTEPENPTEDMIWIDTSSGFDIEKTYLLLNGTNNMTGALNASAGINLGRGGSTKTGIKFYSKDDATQIYMADASNTGSDGVSGDITSPLGINVTKWAMRSMVRAEDGCGWTWETMAEEASAPVIVAELSAIGGNFRTAGTISGSQVFTANSNDYAEFFPRMEDTEAGDIIALATEVDGEYYRKAVETDICVVGVHSESFGHIVGGELPENGEDFVSYNIDKYIPVGLAGRCPVKIIGPSYKGMPIVPSKIPGVGRKFEQGRDNESSIIGYLVESDKITDKVRIRKLKMKIK